MQSAEKWTTLLGWVSFVVVLFGVFVPWGTQGPSLGALPPYVIRKVSWTTSGWVALFLVIGCIATVAGLLGSTVKASKTTITLLGTGGLMIALSAGLFMLGYYERYPFSASSIDQLSFGSLATFAGGGCEFLVALLYTLLVRAQAIR